MSKLLKMSENINTTKNVKKYQNENVKKKKSKLLKMSKNIKMT